MEISGNLQIALSNDDVIDAITIWLKNRGFKLVSCDYEFDHPFDCQSSPKLRSILCTAGLHNNKLHKMYDIKLSVLKTIRDYGSVSGKQILGELGISARQLYDAVMGLLRSDFIMVDGKVHEINMISDAFFSCRLSKTEQIDKELNK
jgi:hypothetical protein